MSIPNRLLPTSVTLRGAMHPVPPSSGIPALPFQTHLALLEELGSPRIVVTDTYNFPRISDLRPNPALGLPAMPRRAVRRRGPGARIGRIEGKNRLERRRERTITCGRETPHPLTLAGSDLVGPFWSGGESASLLAMTRPAGSSSEPCPFGKRA
jgi:hypothetical protein